MAEPKESSFQEIKRIGKLSQDGVFIYDISQNRFLYLNNRMIKIVELNKKLLMEEPQLILNSIPRGDQEYVTIRHNELLQKEFVEDVQFRLVQNRVQKLLSCNGYLTADKSTIIGFLKDITKPKEHEEYLVNFGARKDTILDAVSQHLSTPLKLSKFTVDLIEKALKEKKYNKLSAHLEVMRDVTSECVRVIDDFLIQEHISSPDVYTKADRFDLMAKILVVVDKMKELNPDKEIKVRSNVNHIFIIGDDLKFFQTIHNILSNSIKFTKEKGLIEIIVKDLKNKVQIVVEDNGIGIPDELQPFIFDRDTKAARPGLNGETSTGIGLYVTRKLVGLMHGNISFESRENKGTKFILEFPKH
jgi:two-component system, OmpR family, sensor histidine kinase VicK